MTDAVSEKSITGCDGQSIGKRSGRRSGKHTELDGKPNGTTQWEGNALEKAMDNDTECDEKPDGKHNRERSRQ